ncbi:MAG: c-type cytochrome [Candidatus Methylomirabilia bacterium]
MIKCKPALFRVLVMLALPVVILGLSALPFGRVGIAQEAKFTEEYLTDPKNIELGKKVWLKRCKFCHGKQAYPGKAPRLEPSRYEPEFVYDRVTNGFRGMPPWKEEFSEEERKAVVAYVMSRV